MDHAEQVKAAQTFLDGTGEQIRRKLGIWRNELDVQAVKIKQNKEFIIAVAFYLLDEIPNPKEPTLPTPGPEQANPNEPKDEPHELTSLPSTEPKQSPDTIPKIMIQELEGKYEHVCLCSTCHPISKEDADAAHERLVDSIKAELEQEITNRISHQERRVGWEAGWRLKAKAFMEQLEAVGVPAVCHPMPPDL